MSVVCKHSEHTFAVVSTTSRILVAVLLASLSSGLGMRKHYRLRARSANQLYGPCAELEAHGVMGFHDCEELSGGEIAQVYKALRDNGPPLVVKTDSDLRHSPTGSWETMAMQNLSDKGFDHMPGYEGILGEHGEHWLAMRFLADPPWTTLGDFFGVEYDERTYIKTHPIEYVEALQRFTAIVRAVKDLHAHGWHHCDLHLYNIVVNRYEVDEVRLIDFGQARRLQENNGQCHPEGFRMSDHHRLRLLLPLLLMNSEQVAVDNEERLRGFKKTCLDDRKIDDEQCDKNNIQSIFALIGELHNTKHNFGDLHAFIADDELCKICAGHADDLNKIVSLLPGENRGGPEGVAQVQDLLQVLLSLTG